MINKVMKGCKLLTNGIIFFPKYSGTSIIYLDKKEEKSQVKVDIVEGGANPGYNTTLKPDRLNDIIMNMKPMNQGRFAKMLGLGAFVCLLCKRRGFWGAHLHTRWHKWRFLSFTLVNNLANGSRLELFAITEKWLMHHGTLTFQEISPGMFFNHEIYYDDGYII